MPEYEGETVSPVTEMEEKGVEETATEEPLEEQAEQSDTSAFKQPSSQLEVEAKPKAKTVDKIQKSLVDTSNQIIKQTTQINKIIQNLRSLQKQMKEFERHAEMLNQIRLQINQIQKHITQVHNNVQKRSTSKLRLSKKVSRNKKKSKKKSRK